MTEEVVLNSQIGFQDFVNASAADVIDSYSFRGGDWKSLTRQTNFDENIRKFIVPVDVSYAKFLVLTRVAAGSVVKPHKHKEPMLRYVLEGTFELNGRFYRAGDWVYVPPGVTYEIKTDEGYTTLGGYGMACQDEEE